MFYKLEREAVSAKGIAGVAPPNECMAPKMFFQRPIVFRCKFCKWVSLNLTDDASRQIWLDEDAAFQQAKLDTDDIWWFHSICDVCK
jgi:hypothetical protein